MRRAVPASDDPINLAASATIRAAMEQQFGEQALREGYAADIEDDFEEN